jgi:hypothetical protein
MAAPGGQLPPPPPSLVRSGAPSNPVIKNGTAHIKEGKKYVEAREESSGQFVKKGGRRQAQTGRKGRRATRRHRTRRHR